MKLFSQNCGGLFGFLSYIDDFKGYFSRYSDCDVILIQELRIDEINRDKLIPILEIFDEIGYPYHSVAWSEKGNGGCITLSKTRLTVTGERSKNLLVTHTKILGVHYMIANFYVPNYGYSDGSEKIAFMDRSHDLLQKVLNKGAATIFAGDFNATLRVEHCKYKGKPGSHAEEVAWINKITEKLSTGNVTASVMGSKGEFYTYYSFRGRSKAVQGKILGSMRIDHVFVSEGMKVETVVDNTVTSRDHFPLISKIEAT